jgi:hypothetical protein
VIGSFPYSSVRQMRLDPQRTVRSTQIKGSLRKVERDHRANGAPPSVSAAYSRLAFPATPLPTNLSASSTQPPPIAL